MRQQRIQTFALSIATLAGLFCSSLPASADTLTDSPNIDAIQQDIQDKKASISSIDQQIAGYQAQINAYAKIGKTLQGDLA